MAVDFDNSGLEIVPYLNEVQLSGADITRANRWVLRVRSNKRVLHVWDDSTIGSLNPGDLLEWGGNSFKVADSGKFVRQFKGLTSKEELTTLDAQIGDQALVLTGDTNDPIHRYELIGDDPSVIENWQRIGTGVDAGVVSVNGKAGPDVVLDKADIGLGNVDNTSDADKPISTATQAALDAKADASALSAHVGDTDNPHEVTAAQVGAYTTGEVDGLISAITYTDVGAAAAEHGHVIGDVTGLQTALDGKADLSGATFTGGVAATGKLTLNPGIWGPAVEWQLFVDGMSFINGATSVEWLDTEIMRVGSGDAAIDLYYGNLYVSRSIRERGQPLRERYTRHFLNLESKSDLATLDAAIGDQATVQTGDANDPIHRYELIGDDLDGGTYDTPAENLANWRRIVALNADGEIKGPIINRLVLDTDDTDVAGIGEIVCVVDDLDSPTTASYRMGDGTTKTANLPEIATVAP